MRGAVGERALFDVSAFHLETNGDFDRYRVSSRPLGTFYRNAGASRRFGVESHLMWNPTPEAQVQIAYTWSYFRYTNATSVYGYTLLHARAAYRLSLFGVGAEATFAAVGLRPQRIRGVEHERGRSTRPLSLRQTPRLRSTPAPLPAGTAFSRSAQRTHPARRRRRRAPPG